MRILSHPVTIDNVITCANQEDYVSMDYNAAFKTYQCVGLLYNLMRKIINLKWNL